MRALPERPDAVCRQINDSECRMFSYAHEFRLAFRMLAARHAPVTSFAYIPVSQPAHKETEMQAFHAKTLPAQTAARRHFLQLMGSIPLLPFASGGAALWMAEATGAAAAVPRARAAAPTAIDFIPMTAPNLSNAADMATTAVRSRVEFLFPTGRKAAHALAYHAFFNTGDMVPDGKGGQALAGGYYDIEGRPIIDDSVPGKARQFYSDSPDGSSLLTLKNPRVPGVAGNTVFAVVQFEYLTRNQAGNDVYKHLPAPIAILTLDQNPNTGELSLVQYRTLDTAAIHGLWTPCGASLSPWNTHLSSEEYEPDAANIAHDAAFQSFGRHLYGGAGKANPYHYGHIPEVFVHSDGTGSIVKHYNLGRISHELIQVMPDERTALMGDDATNGGLFLFVADYRRDLSSGNLYVAKWRQTSGVGPGAANLGWIHLGHASSHEIKEMADQLTIADIMDVRTSDPQDAAFTKIPYDGKHNWIRLKPGMEKAAAFLETRRYAAYKGASMGFTKMEGTTVNARDKIAYSAMSYIQSSMLDGSGDIRVEGPRAGAIYALPLRGRQKDNNGKPINSDWTPVSMAAPAALVGEDLPQADALGNLANPDRIANPDNIKFSEAYRTLFIGEDSGMHVNNFLWAYNVDTGKLSRLLSTPAGAEATGLHAVDHINGWTYIMSNFQHPGDWDKKLHSKVMATLDPLIRANYKDRFGASVGYVAVAGGETQA
jgi:secreted PhoX family phosphatase